MKKDLIKDEKQEIKKIITKAKLISHIYDLLDDNAEITTSGRFGRKVRATDRQRYYIINKCQSLGLEYDAKDIKKLTIGEASNILNKLFNWNKEIYKIKKGDN